jgi:hypothetical protein
MADLTITEEMIIQAYGIFLDKEKELDFSTMDKYKGRAARHFENPEEFVRPPYLNEAIDKIKDFTS